MRRQNSRVPNRLADETETGTGVEIGWESASRRRLKREVRDKACIFLEELRELSRKLESHPERERNDVGRDESGNVGWVRRRTTIGGSAETGNGTNKEA